MSDGMIKVFIACGWIAAGLGGVITTLVVTGGPAGGQLVAYAIPAIFLALAYGIYRRSRFCAVVGLVTFGAMRIEWYEVAAHVEQVRGDHTMVGFWASASTFTVMYALAVIGTFSWHARQSGAASKPLSA
jgi:hypothetical protein